MKNSIVSAAEILASIKDAEISAYYGNFKACPKCKAKAYEACVDARGRSSRPLKNRHWERERIEPRTPQNKSD